MCEEVGLDICSCVIVIVMDFELKVCVLACRERERNYGDALHVQCVARTNLLVDIPVVGIIP